MRIRFHILVIVSTVATAVLAAPAAAATPVGPMSFKVTLNAVPDFTVALTNFGPDEAGKYCTLPGYPPRTHERFPCTVPVDVADAGHATTGTIEQVGGTLKGPFTLKCDFILPGVQSGVTVELEDDYSVKPENVLLTSMDGSGPVGCSWAANFGGAGNVAGTSRGTLTLTGNAEQQIVNAAITVGNTVISGSGWSAKAVGGSGTYSDIYETPFSGTVVSRLAAAAAAAPYDGTMTLNIKRASGPKAAIVPLPSPLTKGDPRQLRVVAPRGSTCTGKANRKGTVVKLGRAKVSRGTSETTFKGKLAAKLKTRGTWTLKAVCRSGGEALPTAVARVRRA